MILFKLLLDIIGFFEGHLMFKSLSLYFIPISLFHLYTQNNCKLYNFLYLFHKKPWAKPGGTYNDLLFFSESIRENFLPNVFEFFLKSTTTSKITPL